MDAKTPINSDILITNVRNLAISRRGGVRTRGGRLPPINVRDLTASNKKVIAPKFPQRRRVVKTEADSLEQVVIKTEKSTSFENTRGRGKGRQQRVYLQTEGSFLAEGPAAKLKRDPVSNDCFSVPRISRKSTKGSSDRNIDADAVKDLMESYVAGEEYENYNEGKPPIRLPVQRVKMTGKIKLESDTDDKTKIKKEIVEDIETGVKMEIKSEVDEEFESAEVFIKEEIKSEKKSKDNFLNAKDDGTLILLQLPLLTHSLKSDDQEKDSAVKEKGKGEKEKEKGEKGKNKPPAKENEKKLSKFMDNFEEGFLGKLKIMKSGRMKLLLGSVEFELLDGTPSETYQEAVSVKFGSEEGDVTILGKIENKLILSPVINKLLAENVENKKSLNLEEE